MNTRQQAEEIYNRTRISERQMQMLGETMLRRTNPVAFATVEEIEAHLVMVAGVANEIGVQLYADRIPFGATREQVVEQAQAKLRQQRRSAGARALSAKYGKTAAEQIIARKTGRRINLQR